MAHTGVEVGWVRESNFSEVIRHALSLSDMIRWPPLLWSSLFLVQNIIIAFITWYWHDCWFFSKITYSFLRFSVHQNCLHTLPSNLFPLGQVSRQIWHRGSENYTLVNFYKNREEVVSLLSMLLVIGNTYWMRDGLKEEMDNLRK